MELKEEPNEHQYHKCDRCCYKTRSPYFMKNHLNSTNHQPQFSCLDSTVESYECYSCNYTSTILVHFKKHTKTDVRTIPKQYKCSICAFETYSQLVYVKHVCDRCYQFDVKVEEIVWFTCEKCSFKAKRRRYLLRHIRLSHSAAESIKWFKCDKCPFKTKWRTNLKLHTTKHTIPEDIEWFNCVHCSFKTKWKGDLQRHIIGKHTASEDIKWFRCEQCSFKAKQKAEVKQHMTKHKSFQDIKLFNCDCCAFKTKWKSSLWAHAQRKHPTQKKT